MAVPNSVYTSSVSGKEVAYSTDEYCKGSNRISFDEVDFNKKHAPADLKGATSILSLLPALKPIFHYCGNIVIGNSKYVQNSTNISDSFYVDESSTIADSKYSAICTKGRLFESCFGSYGLGESEFCIRCTQTYREKRCFEVWVSQNCSDSYYCYNLNNCSDCIFCFNLKNKKYCVGNVEVGKEKFHEIKKRLVSEIVATLKKEKKALSLLDIIKKSSISKPKNLKLERARQGSMDNEPVEKAFSLTTKLLLGKSLSGIDQYSNWLEKHTYKIQKTSSCLSGKEFPVMPQGLFARDEIPRDRVIDFFECDKIGEVAHLSKHEAENISLANAHESIGALAFLNIDFWEGVNKNMPDCTLSIDCTDCYKCSATVYSKFCGYTFWPRSSENCFGCNIAFDSSFCINCYNSVKLTRCFEMDTCRSCSDSYFCHNCENVHDSMFCFNAKNLKYAIGNAEVGREKFLEAKKALQEYLLERLEKGKSLDLDIYNLGCAGK